MDKKMTQEQYDALLEEGLTPEKIDKGYDIFQCSGSSSVIENALVIERIDLVDKFASDFEVCRQAEMDGIKFINDMPGLEKGCYIDTEENRAYCSRMLHEHPEYRLENWINSGDTSESYRSRYRKVFGDV